MRPIGVHTSIKGGLFNSINEALALKCDTFQIFLHSPRVWKIQKISIKTRDDFKKQREKANLHPFIVHASYLINLVSSKTHVVELSKQLLLDELKLADELEADYYVIHLTDNMSMQKEEIITKIKNVFIKVETKKCKILIENTARGRITSSMIDLIDSIYQINSKLIAGVCIDTCHLFASGYDISNDKGISKFMNELFKSKGFELIKLIHLNDSKTPLGSRIDRHEHIGKGYIGIEGFKRFLRIKELSHLPLILETPKKTPLDDPINLNTVREILMKLES